MNNLFSSAASLLLGDASGASVNHGAHALLTELGYVPSEPAGVGLETRHRARLLQAASQFIRIFELAAPEAPALIAFGAEVDPGAADAAHQGSPPVSVSGIGLSLQEAFQGCIGEGVEYLSGLQRADDTLVSADGAAALDALDQHARELMMRLQSRAQAALTWHRAS